MTEDGDLIDRLEEIKLGLKNSIGHRRYWLYINNLPEEEQKKHLKIRRAVEYFLLQVITQKQDRLNGVGIY